MTKTNPTDEKGGESQLDKIYKSDLWKEIEENFEFFNECIEDADVRDFYKRLIWQLVESHAPSPHSESIEEAANELYPFKKVFDAHLFPPNGADWFDLNEEKRDAFLSGISWQSQQTANALKEARKRIAELEEALEKIKNIGWPNTLPDAKEIAQKVLPIAPEEFKTKTK